jgi:hypothetical protein
VSITARVLGAVDDPTYRTSFEADIRDVLMLGHFEDFRDHLRGYLDSGAVTAAVLGGERSSEVRLEPPALHELGSTERDCGSGGHEWALPHLSAVTEAARSSRCAPVSETGSVDVH